MFNKTQTTSKNQKNTFYTFFSSETTYDIKPRIVIIEYEMQKGVKNNIYNNNICKK